MPRSAWISLAVLAAWPLAAAAQPAAKAPQLTAQEQLGRQLFTQSCSVCHTKPALTAGLYGPPLLRDSAGGDPAVMKQTLPPPVASSGGSTKSDMD